ncbi:MAG: N-acetylglucosamine transport system permease protein [Thermomicrobiales bacterium]|jgi:N-acetylglucosamine transport system permease protein|nr:N-acetylglucosamine transport system permease protein [Thermomicrobiales bacterium]MEA2527694.1 N-acetylglucosamine transport system permease protein [Thermomicrobiales bacterium]MEA2586483.1 N-acetylglucosamine transport system permease protein [Thermomicrobiales bacterium]MEA2598861.1 N-acetylglucosamine transport system permease protein [Thermomicrobiales bacterium]
MSAEAFRPIQETRPVAEISAVRRRPRTVDAVAVWVTQAMLGIWALLVIFPFVWMIMTSLKTDGEIIASPWELPSALQWDNFARAWTDARIGRFFVNTIIVLAGSLTGTLLVSAMAAYVLARFVFPGRQFIYFAFAAGLMFPVYLALVPLYFLVDDLDRFGLGLATYQSLILVYIAYSLPFTIFFLTAFFKTLPSELGEAAILDGASHYQIFFQVMLPLAKPGLIAMGIFNFLGQWNQFLLPLVLMPETLDPDKLMLSQGLYFLSIQGTYDSDYSALFAAMVITMIPTLIVYILFQRRLEAGLTAGALKG